MLECSCIYFSIICVFCYFNMHTNPARVLVVLVFNELSSLLFLLPRAPDGSCILTNSADNVLRVYNIPPEIYSYNWDLLPEMVSTQIACHRGPDRRREMRKQQTNVRVNIHYFMDLNSVKR